MTRSRSRAHAAKLWAPSWTVVARGAVGPECAGSRSVGPEALRAAALVRHGTEFISKRSKKGPDGGLRDLLVRAEPARLNPKWNGRFGFPGQAEGSSGFE